MSQCKYGSLCRCVSMDIQVAVLDLRVTMIA